MPLRTEHVAIVGAGFAGTLLAINLLRHGGTRVTLIERQPERIARGVAYAAAGAEHLLNVRAGNMSAFDDDATHFVRWLERNELGDATMFAPRRLYGAYLRELLEESLRGSGAELRIVHAEAVALSRRDAGCRLTLADGASLDADVVVLAPGNLPPHTPPGITAEVECSERYFGDPWAHNLVEGLKAIDTVVLIGSGLTAVDVALSLDAEGFAGTVIAVSRRGLRPHVHAAMPPAVGLREKPADRLSDLVRHVRRRADEIGWRGAVDELRPVTQLLWGGADEITRARFLRHLRPFWDVHRHRLAPAVATRIGALVGAGRLRIAAGKLATSRLVPEGIELTWRRRSESAIETMTAARVVNCTGPQGDLMRSPEPLIASLLAAGAIQPDPLRIGIHVDQQSRVIDASGCANDRLYCIGPMTRGAFWEVVAVPDLRRQNGALARRLTHAEWVNAAL
ncbi:FAD/NAD(P)-binding protein [Sphingomonas sp. TX0543]|uniref:FAD/NAD(P)-binding protein n=1 Tax=unclassified Sphingomonas TaxID=196159 RepID=UPI0010F7A4A1|nr:FAD-dependent oxidoreductase [Sphingomonas sp. 3P27F8]